MSAEAWCHVPRKIQIHFRCACSANAHLHICMLIPEPSMGCCVGMVLHTCLLQGSATCCPASSYLGMSACSSRLCWILDKAWFSAFLCLLLSSYSYSGVLGLNSGPCSARVLASASVCTVHMNYTDEQKYELLVAISFAADFADHTAAQ